MRKRSLETPSPSEGDKGSYLWAAASKVFCQTISRTLSLFFFSYQLPEVEINLDDPKATIFSYVQKVALAAGISRNERVRRIWEPTYTYVPKTNFKFVVGTPVVNCNLRVHEAKEKTRYKLVWDFTKCTKGVPAQEVNFCYVLE